MKSTHSFLFTRILPVVLMLLGLSACDALESDDTADPELAQLSASITDELSVSSERASEIESAFTSHRGGDREAGRLWNVAAELQQTLTDEEKAALLDNTKEMERGLSFKGLLGFPGAGGFYGLGGFKGGSGRHGLSDRDSVLNLTDEQQEAIKAIHEASRETIRALREALDAGTITEDALLAQLFDLVEQKQADIQAVLTDEQIQALETYRSEKEANFEAFRAEVILVRNDVLGLSTDEATTMDAIYQDQLDSREVLIEQLQTGTITLTELRAEVEILEAVRLEALTALLDAVQLEIVQIHDALSVRAGRFGHRGGRHGKGGRGQGHGHTYNG